MSTNLKPLNQKAWLLVLPVIVCVAFSAVLLGTTVGSLSGSIASGLDVRAEDGLDPQARRGPHVEGT